MRRIEKSYRTTAENGLTLIELLVILAVVAVLIGVLMPVQRNGGARILQSNCMNNLRQTGMAFRTWAANHGGHYPVAVPMAEGGALELAPKGDSWRVFQILSNELASAKIPACPADPIRSPATNFSSMTGSNVSYFVGVDAEEKRGKMFLAGDRNWEIDGNQAGADLVAVGTNATVSWTQKFHRQSGNILFADGSVMKLSDSQLRSALATTGTNVNRLVFP